VVLGVETNAPLLDAVLASEEFASGRYATDLVSRLPPAAASPTPDTIWIAAALELARGSPRGGEALRSLEPWDETSGWRPSS
jgi:hypothetical protein